jgi:hypothetical protein
LLQVDYQLEFAEWLLVTGCEPDSKEHAPEALLLAAVNTLTQLEEAAAEGESCGALVVLQHVCWTCCASAKCQLVATSSKLCQVLCKNRLYVHSAALQTKEVQQLVLKMMRQCL